MRRRDPASFRDPDGFVFRQEGEVFRHVAAHYRPTYDLLKGSGLYADLISAGLLVPHAELGEVGAGAFLIKPDKVPFISYPFEWSFEQLRDAASATLDVMERALAKGLWLKDASAYNTQFLQGAPTLIDTLSFEAYRDGEGWPAYHQFCKHFLAPLAIMRWKGAAMSRLLVSHIDGVPLDLASRLLPWRSHVSLGIALHVHGHAKAQRWYAAQQPVKPKRVAKNDVVNLVRHLKGTVEGLKTPSVQGHWADYCDNTNYTPAAIAQKQTLIERVAAAARPSLALDLGANTGLLSRIVAQHAGFVVSAD